MHVRGNLWRDRLLPQVAFVAYAIAWLLLTPFVVMRWFRGTGRTAAATLCVEAGAPGWRSIEFKELLQSAVEYMGADRVHRIEIDKSADYTPQTAAAFDKYRPTHYVYDPRTGSEKWHVGVLQSLRFAFLCAVRGVTPIVILADFSHRVFRMQAAVATARAGVVISFLSAREGGAIFPHRRIVAPSLMPLSQATLAMLARIREQRPAGQPNKALFMGSLYEPRTTILQAIAQRLQARGHTLEIRGRVAGGPRVPDEEYWAGLSHAGVIVTTADQIDLPINDWKWISHLTYRYLEAIVSGSLLIAPEVPGIRRYFTPGEHFVPFTSIDDAADRIAHFLEHETERVRIAQQGRSRASDLVSARAFWLVIDASLGKDSLV